MIGVLSELFGTDLELRLSVAEAGEGAHVPARFRSRPA